MAFIPILIMGALGTFLFVIVFCVLSLIGITLLVVGIISLKRNKKAEKRIVAPVTSIVFGGIFLLPVVMFYLLWIYGIVVHFLT